MFIEIPAEVIRKFAGSNENSKRVVSALYYNVEGLFPSERPGINK